MNKRTAFLEMLIMGGISVLCGFLVFQFSALEVTTTTRIALYYLLWAAIPILFITFYNTIVRSWFRTNEHVFTFSNLTLMKYAQDELKNNNDVDQELYNELKERITATEAVVKQYKLKAIDPRDFVSNEQELIQSNRELINKLQPYLTNKK